MNIWCFIKTPKANFCARTEQNGNQDPKSFCYKRQVSRDAAHVVTKQGTIVEYVPERKTVNSELDLKVLENSLTNISTEKPNFDIKATQLVPLTRKYSSNPSITVKYFLVNRGVVVIGQPPQSPDLATAGVFLYSKVKTASHGADFWTSRK